MARAAEKKGIEGTFTQGRPARPQSEPTLGWNDETPLVFSEFEAGGMSFDGSVLTPGYSQVIPLGFLVSRRP
jgi:hypothetical protein